MLHNQGFFRFLFVVKNSVLFMVGDDDQRMECLIRLLNGQKKDQFQKFQDYFMLTCTSNNKTSFLFSDNANTFWHAWHKHTLYKSLETVGLLSLIYREILRRGFSKSQVEYLPRSVTSRTYQRIDISCWAQKLRKQPS